MKDIWCAAREGSVNELDLALAFLKKNGGNVDTKNALGLTALHIATWRNHLPIVKRLLSAGADPDIRDGESGWSSLHRALHFGHLAVAGVLLQYGATITLEDSKSRTPIDLISGPVMQAVGEERDSVSTEVFSWGSGTNYQLGTGNAHIQKVPCKIDALHGSYVKMTTAAKFHSVAVGSGGELYTWGFGRGGRLGLPDFDIHSGQSAVIAPRRVTSGLGSRRVLAIAAAKHHTIIATENGDVFTWGSNREGQLGYPSVDTQPTPRRVSSLRPRIIAVAAANKHSAAVSESGEVFTWGCNKEGQLGYGTSNSASNYTPRVVECLKGRNFKAVSAAKYHTVVLGTDGEVFTWGHRLVNPKRVIIARNIRKGGGIPLAFHRTSRLQITAVVAGMVHSTALADDGSLFYWISSDPDLRCQQMHSMRGREVLSISAGKYWTAAATSAGDVYILDGKKYKDEAPIPTRLNGIKNATSVSVGETHLLILCSLYHPPYLSRHEIDGQKSRVETCEDLEEFDADFMFDDPQPESKLKEDELFARKSVPSLKSLCEKMAAEFLVEPRNSVSLLDIADSLEANDLWAHCEDIVIRNLSFILTVSAPSIANVCSEVLAKLERAMQTKSSEPWSSRRLPPPTAAAFPAIIIGEEEETNDRYSRILEKLSRCHMADAFLPPDATDPEIVKQVRAVRKKLQQIEILEAKKSKGQPLDDQQIAKLQSRALLESTLVDLGFPLEIPQKPSPSLQEDGKRKKKKNKVMGDSPRNRAKTKQKEGSSKEFPNPEFESFIEQVPVKEWSPGEREAQETSKLRGCLSSDSPSISKNLAKKKNRKGGLLMFLNGSLDDGPKAAVTAPLPSPLPKREGPAWGGITKLSKDTTFLHDIQQEQIMTKGADHFVIGKSTENFVADVADSGGKVLLGSLLPLTKSNPIPVVSSGPLVAPNEGVKSPLPWSSSGSSPIQSRPSLRDIQMQQAKKQEPGMAHSPKAKTSGFSTVRPGSTPPLNIATPSRWFKPEVDSPSPIRSILIEEKAIKDLKRFYSNVKLVKPNPDAAS